MAIQYKKQWSVPSSSSDKLYKVSLTMNDQYQCSCPVWIFHRKECKHIQDVKDGIYDFTQDERPPYKMEFAMVREVTMEDDRVTIKVPLCPLGDPDFYCTILYDLVQIGVSWKDAAEIERIPNKLKYRHVLEHVQAHGRKIYGEWVEEKGFVGFQYVNI